MPNKIIINSKGEIVTLNGNQSSVRILRPEQRIKELQEIETDILNCLKEHNFATENKQCFFAVQTQYTKEKLFYFCKTPVAASSTLVKYSNNLPAHPEILRDKYKTNFFRSVVADKTVKAPCWYVLKAGEIEFERNLYDCKRINVKVMPPIPYVQALENINQLLAPEDDTEEASPYYELYACGLPLTDISSVIPAAFDRDSDDEGKSALDNLIESVVAEHCRKYGYSKRDKFSNISTFCLSIANDTDRDIFSMYKAIKLCLNKNFDNIGSVLYKKNRVFVRLNDTGEELMLYIGGADNKLWIMLNGHILQNTEELKSLVESHGYSDMPPWYQEKVIPNIQNITEINKAAKQTDTERLNWFKKRRK